MERLKNFLENVFCGDRLKNFCEDLFFFGEHLRLCPWSLALASSIPVLGLESVCPRKGCPWPWPRALCPRLRLCFALSLSMLNVKQGSCKSQFYSLWFDPTGNRIRVCRFSIADALSTRPLIGKIFFAQFGGTP